MKSTAKILLSALLALPTFALNAAAQNRVIDVNANAIQGTLPQAGRSRCASCWKRTPISTKPASTTSTAGRSSCTCCRARRRPWAIDLNYANK